MCTPIRLHVSRVAWRQTPLRGEDFVLEAQIERRRALVISSVL